MIVVANQTAMANLSHIFAYDSSANSFSPNLLNLVPPYALLPAAPAVGDILYLGIDSTLVNSGIFWNVVFNLVGGSAGLGITWEFWNGAAWAAIPTAPAQVFNDETSSLRNSGLRVLGFYFLLTWATTAINGVTAWWIRGRVTAWAAGAVPLQIDQQVFVARTPYVEVPDGAVEGDVDSLSEAIINPSLQTGLRVLMGRRRLSRGSDFNAYINVSDTQQPIGVTTTLISANAVWITSPTAPTGRSIQWVPPGILTEDVFRITITSPLSAEYLGRYHLYLRGAVGGVIGNEYQYVRNRVKVGIGSATEIIYTSPWGGWNTSAGFAMSELGQVLIELGNPNYPPSTLYLTFELENSDPGAKSVICQDIVLLPSDEMELDTTCIGPDGATLKAGTLRIDSARLPKERVLARYGVPYIEDLRWSGRFPLSFAPRAESRLWFLSAGYTAADGGNSGTNPTGVFKVDPSHLVRYLSMRGDR